MLGMTKRGDGPGCHEFNPDMLTNQHMINTRVDSFNCLQYISHSKNCALQECAYGDDGVYSLVDGENIRTREECVACADYNT